MTLITALSCPGLPGNPPNGRGWLPQLRVEPSGAEHRALEVRPREPRFGERLAEARDRLSQVGSDQSRLATRGLRKILELLPQLARYRQRRVRSCGSGGSLLPGASSPDWTSSLMPAMASPVRDISRAALRGLSGLQHSNPSHALRRIFTPIAAQAGLYWTFFLITRGYIPCLVELR